MKSTKKLLALLLTLALIATLIPAVFADETYTITVNPTYTQAMTHTYEAYQIFSGKLGANSDGKTVLTEIDWGTGVTGATVISKLGTDYAGKSASDVAAALTNGTLTVAAFEAAVKKALTTAKATSSKNETTGKYEINVTGAGYYLVKDKDSTITEVSDAYTLFILEIVKSREVNTKAAVPSVDKFVKDINDSTQTSEDSWAKTADHDVGDEINYKLEGTLPSNYDAYTSYYYMFTDTMCKGLDYVSGSYSVHVDSETGTDITSAFTFNSSSVSSGEYKEGTQITFTCDNLKAITDKDGNAVTLTSSSKIIVLYKAKLNSYAVIGSTGNPNQVNLTFSNNPNAGGTGEKGKTPDHKNIVFTYQVTINKVDEDNDPIEGAKFRLYKYNADTSSYDIDLGEITGSATKDDGGNVTKVSYSWDRVDDGKYKIVETEAPTGYNKASDKYFEITASHDNTTLQLSPTFGDVTGHTSTDEVLAFSNGVATIQNKPGNTLPSTGGVGTTIFYVVGSILAIGAFVLLVAKKRASRAN